MYSPAALSVVQYLKNMAHVEGGGALKLNAIQLHLNAAFLLVNACDNWDQAKTSTFNGLAIGFGILDRPESPIRKTLVVKSCCGCTSL